MLEVDAADVVCEDGEVRHIDGELPYDFPLGYHWLQSPEGCQRRLIASLGALLAARRPRLARRAHTVPTKGLFTIEGVVAA